MTKNYLNLLQMPNYFNAKIMVVEN